MKDDTTAIVLAVALTSVILLSILGISVLFDLLQMERQLHRDGCVQVEKPAIQVWGTNVSKVYACKGYTLVIAP